MKKMKNGIKLIIGMILVLTIALTATNNVKAYMNCDSEHVIFGTDINEFIKHLQEMWIDQLIQIDEALVQLHSERLAGNLDEEVFIQVVLPLELNRARVFEQLYFIEDKILIPILNEAELLGLSMDNFVFIINQKQTTWDNFNIDALNSTGCPDNNHSFEIISRDETSNGSCSTYCSSRTAITFSRCRLCAFAMISTVRSGFIHAFDTQQVEIINGQVVIFFICSNCGWRH